MSLFNYNSDLAIDYNELTQSLEQLSTPKTRSLSTNRGTIDRSKNFYIFQIVPGSTTTSVVDLSKVTPAFSGDEDAPDVLMQLEMLCFNMANSEKVNSKTRATMRMVVQQMDSIDNRLEPLVWVISAGLQLYDITNKRRAKAQDLKMDFRKTFGNRPIEVPKGKVRLTFDVFKHKPPKWWKKVFRFLLSDKGKSLTSVVGFPAVTQQAVGVINELLNKLGRSKTEVLFQSVPLELVLNEKAKQLKEVDGITKAGVLKPGLFVLCQGGDLAFFKENPATYFDQIGCLAPEGTEPAELFSPGFKNPFDEKTYSIFRIGMKPVKLDLEMIFGAL